MPVLSPHRSSASTLSGSYRSTFSSSSTIDRPYFNTSTYSPRITSYSERYRRFTDSDGRRIFSRSGSVTEDGLTTRYWEESRESSARRDSLSRESLPENSYSSSRRDSSLSRDSSQRLSSVSVLDSVAELRNKYSPSNYVPACLRERNNDNITRSKSINDIGLPPIEHKIVKKKVNELNFNSNNSAITTTPTATVFNNSNHTNNDNIKLMDDDDDDDNNNRASVADLRKKFDKNIENGEKLSSTKNNVDKKSKTKESTIKTTPKKVSKSDISKLDVKSDSCNGTLQCEIKQNSSRVNNFASYIPSKDYQKDSNTNGDKIEEPETFTEDNQKRNELSTSPKLSTTTTTTTNSRTSPPSTATNNLSSSKRSTERDRVGYNNDDHYHHQNNHQSSSYNNSTTTNSPIKQLGLNGLKNIGNTCFMNSVIQCLSNTKLLLEYLLKDCYINDINTSTSSMKGALIKSFVEVIKELWSEDASDRVVNTTSLKSQIQRFAPRFIGYAQQDAQEFLRYLLEGLHEDVNRVKERPKPILTEIDEKLSDAEKSSESWSRYLRMDNSRIVDCFVGQLKSTLKCTHCGHCSVTFDPFWDLSLPIPQRAGQVRLSQCLESFTREETLDGDEKPTCSKCKERRRCTKSFTIQKFPKILVIHLKRFSLAERFRGKLSVTVDFPLEGLDMSHYAADNGSPCRYNLYAISNHSGTTYSGHYTAYCRHPYTKTWHEYNDSRVSSISSKSIVSGEAYVLFYEQDGQKSHL